MPLALVGSAFSGTSGGATSAALAFTLPTGITTGDSWAVVFVNNNGTSATLTAAGWTIYGPVTISTGHAWVCVKAVASGDSGTGVTFNLSGPQRWSLSGGVWNGVAGLDQAPVSATDDVGASNILTLPGFTPNSGGCLSVAGLGGIRPAANANGVAGIIGYSAVLSGGDAVTTFGSANNVESAVATKQLATTAAQPSAAGTWNTATRDVNFVVLLAPKNPAGSGTFGGAGTLVAAGIPTIVDTAALNGFGSLRDIGTPAITDTAALNGAGTLAAAVGGVALAGTAAFSGAGTLTGAGGIVAGAQLAGDGTLTAEKAKAGYLDVFDPYVWLKHPSKVWDGRQWTTHPVKTWNGAAWEAHL